MGASTKVVLREPSFFTPYAVVGHRGKVIRFRRPRGGLRNVADIYAAIHAAASPDSTTQGHYVFCSCCGNKARIEGIAAGKVWGWEYRDRRWLCFKCRQGEGEGARSWR